MCRYIANLNSGKVHMATCEYGLGTHPANADYFEELYDAAAQGYEECGVCLGPWGEHLAQFKEVLKDAKREAFGDCLVCGETRGIQKAHIIPKSAGGVSVMPLCPNHHWNYDHGLLKSSEFDSVVRWILGEHGQELGSWVEREYIEKRDQVGIREAECIE